MYFRDFRGAEGHGCRLLLIIRYFADRAADLIALLCGKVTYLAACGGINREL